eukprot:s955_g3.t2
MPRAGPRLLIDNVGPSQGLLPMFKGYFEDPQYKKVFHNYAFDRHMLKREGCPVQGLEADTLVLARIQDTAKSAWEGPARAAMQQKNEQLKQSYERMQVAPAAPTYPVTRINFGGHAMDVKAVSMLMSGIHTVALPAVEDKKGGLQSNLLYGYDLKTLATTFGLTDKDQKLERFPFGAKADAALQALTSPETFTKFVEYATLDADDSEVGAADAGQPRSRSCFAALWRDTQTKVLKGYRPEQLRRSLAFALLAAYHNYVFLAAALSIVILSGNLILAWFISWFQEVRNLEGALDPGKVSLGYYLAVLLRCWLLIHLSAELLRCTIWLVEDCWEVQTFQTYRRICTGAAFLKMREAQPVPAVAKQLSCSGWAHGSSWQWWLDLLIQALIYATIDVVPLVFAVVAWNALPISDFDIRAAALAPGPGEVLREPQADEEDFLQPANFCALFGGFLQLGWVMILKAVFFSALVIFAIQRDMADENPFWLVAALLLGVAFWHSSFAQGLQLLAGWLEMSSWRSCLPCNRTDEEAETLSAEGDARFLCVPVQLAAKLQAWGAAHAGLSATALAGQYELAVYALLLQLTLFGNFKWVEGGIFILLLIILLLFRRATLLRLGNWCAFFGLLESTFLVVLAVAMNAAYSGCAGGGAVLVLALLLQCTLMREELRAWRVWRAVILGLHCSLVLVVALCMWSMQGGSGWTQHRAQPRVGLSTYPWCDLQWPLGQGSGRYLTITNFADICAMTNLPGSDFNATLKSQFPGWTLVFERRAGKSQSDKSRDGYYDWTTFFELADPQNESTLFAVRGTQSPLEVLQDVNIFTPVVLTQIAAFFGPDLTSSVTKTVFSLFSGLPSIDKDFFQAGAFLAEVKAFLAHVRARVRSDPSRRYYLTGHSLGGGLAKLVALEVGQPSVTFAAPGLRYTSQMLLSNEAIYTGSELLEAGEHLSTNVVPEHDLVSRIDQQLGAQLGVACKQHCSTPAHSAAKDKSCARVLTWRLFERLKLLLLERPWTTEVHKLPVLQLLSDDAAADAIAAELRSYGTKPKPFSCAGERKRASKSRSLAGTPGTVQLRTGQTIWDFYQQNLRELPECLAKMQDRGVPVDAATLERLVDISCGDLQTKTSLLRETLKSIRKPDGSALCEEVSAININSAQQLQTLLFGGADFMLLCFRRQMNGAYHDIEWQLPSPLPSLRKIEANFKEEVEKSNAAGWLIASGSLPARCRVIATYLEPPDLPARGSSKVCRFPIPMMLVDVSPLLTVDASDDAPATAAGLPKIKLPVKGWGGKEKRLLATLRVKLSLFLVGQNIGLDQLHIPQHEKSDLRRTFRDIQDQLDKKGNLESKLVGAIRSFRVALPEMDDYVSGAVDFLLGVEDKKADDKRYRGGRGVVSLANRKLSLPLEILMSSRDIEAKALELFCVGQDLFRDSILGGSTWCDGMVMERAFAWVLSCKAAKSAAGFRLKDSGRRLKFQAEQLRDGLQQFDGRNARVFTKKGKPCISCIRNMKDGVMYHALSEGGCAGTHKGFDIWFKTTDGHLVRSSVANFSNCAWL